MKYEITRKYRTKHSIFDSDVDNIIKYIETLSPLNNVIDFGCHFGHLSIELAIRYPINIYSVDNFIGYGDVDMTETIQKIINRKDTRNFFDKFIENIKENEDSLKGKIYPFYVDRFFDRNIKNVDFCYCDADHGKNEYINIKKLTNIIRKNGILSGHDYHAEWIKKIVTELINTKEFKLLGIYDGSWFMEKI